jgi:hypothetical protein
MPSAVAIGTMVIQTTSGHQIVLDDNGASLTVTDSNGNSITLDGSGITLQCANGGGTVALTDAEVNVNNGNLEVQV